MKTERTTFCLEIPVNDPEKMELFNELMGELQDAQIREAKGLAKELGVSEACAFDIQYLRGRSRWTSEAESELIRRDQAGEELPNIMEWP
jgi:hypothetical protein